MALKIMTIEIWVPLVEGDRLAVDQLELIPAKLRRAAKHPRRVGDAFDLVALDIHQHGDRQGRAVHHQHQALIEVEALDLHSSSGSGSSLSPGSISDFPSQ